MIVPRLEVPDSSSAPTSKRVFAWSDEDGYFGAFQQAIRELGLHGKTLGVDGLTMRVTEWLMLQASIRRSKSRPSSVT